MPEQLYHGVGTFMKRVLILISIILMFMLPSLVYSQDVSTEAPISQKTVGAPITGHISNVGLAPFALFSPSFPCAVFIKSASGLPVLHLATLYNTFGNDLKCFNQIKNDPRLQTFELNLLNEPGHRNGRLGSYEFLKPYTVAKYNSLLASNSAVLKERFIRYVQGAKAIIGALPANVQCIINPGLESNVGLAASKTLIRWTKEQFPNCRTVYNPLARSSDTNRKRVGADLREGHGSMPSLGTACLTNLDGTDINFRTRPSYMDKSNYVNAGRALTQHIASYASKCEIVFLWIVEYNCNGGSANFVDPRKRQCGKYTKAFPLVAGEAKKAMNTIHPYVPYAWTPQELLAKNKCVKFAKANDGDKTGFLMKQSEFSDRGGVVILPSGTRVSKVSIAHENTTVDRYSTSGSYDHDGQGRQMFRSNISPTTYPFHIVIHADNICYVIDNPQSRVD